MQLCNRPATLLGAVDVRGQSGASAAMDASWAMVRLNDSV